MRGATSPCPGAVVLVLAYGCLAGKVGRMAYSGEHTGVGYFGVGELGGMDLPAGYARAARAWVGMARKDRPGF